MRYTYAKATIKTPSGYLGMNRSDRLAGIAAALRNLAADVEAEKADFTAKRDRNGNTIAVEVKA